MLHLMKLRLRYLMLKITHNYKLCCWLNSWKFFMWLVLCLTFNNSAKSSSNSTFWGCFGILKTSRIQNCHWNSILSKMRKTGKRPRQVKLRVLYIVVWVIQWGPGKMVQALNGSSTTSKPFWLLQCILHQSVDSYPWYITNWSLINPQIWPW